MCVSVFFNIVDIFFICLVSLMGYKCRRRMKWTGSVGVGDGPILVPVNVEFEFLLCCIFLLD
jgi:hypothetical protein